MLTFAADPTSTDKVNRLLQVQFGPQAAQALNQAAAAAKMAMADVIAADLKVPAAEVKKYLWVKPATPDHLESRVEPRAKAGIPFIKIGATGPEPSRGQGNGVIVGGQQYPHAFIARMPSGHRGVFERSGKSRLPIRELRTESVWSAFRRLRAVGEARGLEALKTDLAKDLKSALKKSA